MSNDKNASSLPWGDEAVIAPRCKAIEREHVATSGCVTENGYPRDPVRPDGDGWTLVCCCLYQEKAEVYWYWEREMLTPGREGWVAARLLAGLEVALAASLRESGRGKCLKCGREGYAGDNELHCMHCFGVLSPLPAREGEGR